MKTTNEKKSLYLVFKEQFFLPEIDPDFEPVDDETYDQALDNMTDAIFTILASYVLNPDNTIDPLNTLVKEVQTFCTLQIADILNRSLHIRNYSKDLDINYLTVKSNYIK